MIRGNHAQITDLETAQSCYQRSLDLYRNHEDAWGLSRALTGLGISALAMGQAAQAQENFKECLAIQEEVKDQRWSAINLNLLAVSRRDQGYL